MENAQSTHRPLGPEDSELVTPLEGLSAIQAMNVDAAFGLDGIPVICSKNCCSILFRWLREVFCSSLVVGYFPKKWHIVKPLALCNPRKANYVNPQKLLTNEPSFKWGQVIGDHRQ